MAGETFTCLRVVALNKGIVFNEDAGFDGKVAFDPKILHGRLDRDTLNFTVLIGGDVCGVAPDRRRLRDVMACGTAQLGPPMGLVKLDKLIPRNIERGKDGFGGTREIDGVVGEMALEAPPLQLVSLGLFWCGLGLGDLGLVITATTAQG